MLVENMNTTGNETQPSNCTSPSSHTAQNLGKTFAYCLILVVSFTGNSLIGIIIYKTKPMRRTINFLIVNMAMSDLLLPLIVFPSLLIETYAGGFGKQGKTICMVLLVLQYISNSVSIQSLILIAVDRFVAVVFPLRSPFISLKMCPFVILATWIVATASSLPILAAFSSMELRVELNCERIWFQKFFREQYYSHVRPVLIVLYIIPFVVLIILYSAILFKLNSKKTPGEPSINAEEQRVKRHKNVLKMVIAILLGFAVCWMPFNILSFVGHGIRDSAVCGVPLLTLIALFLTYANCAINPCICLTFSGNFREGLKSFFKWDAPLQG